MQCYLFRPTLSQSASPPVPLGAIIVHTEIYQVTAPLRRTCRQLASEGFNVVIGECYHEYLPPGTVLAYDDEGTATGNRLKVTKSVVAYDGDNAAIVNAIKGVLSEVSASSTLPDGKQGASLSPPSDPAAALRSGLGEPLFGLGAWNGHIGTVGMCLGGHLSLRTLFVPGVCAAVCFFPTDVHQGSLGDGGDDSLDRIKGGALCERKGEKEVTMLFGRQDGHVPEAGRAAIHGALRESGADFQYVEVNAQHAFIRDEMSKGRYDPSITNIGFTILNEVFRRRVMLGLGSSAFVTPQPSAGPKC